MAGFSPVTVRLQHGQRIRCIVGTCNEKKRRPAAIGDIIGMEIRGRDETHKRDTRLDVVKKESSETLGIQN